jgi:hypothetical protein
VPAAVKIINDAGLLALLAADDLPSDADGEEDLQALRRRMNEGLCRYGAHIDGFAGDRQTRVAVTAEARVAEPGLGAEYILLGGHPRSPGGATNRQRVVYEDRGLIGAVSKLAAELG